MIAHVLRRDIDKWSHFRTQRSRRKPNLDRQCSRSANARGLDILHHPHSDPIYRDSLDLDPANFARPLLHSNHTRRRYTSIDVYISIPLVKGSVGNHLSCSHRLFSDRYWLHGHLANHQWFRSLLLHVVGIRLQVPLYLGMGSTKINGHRWPILSQSHQSRICRFICPGDMSLRIILPG